MEEVQINEVPQHNLHFTEKMGRNKKSVVVTHLNESNLMPLYRGSQMLELLGIF